jgi:hypothetical protein
MTTLKINKLLKKKQHKNVRSPLLQKPSAMKINGYFIMAAHLEK